ncbi:MAG: ankyrin repeat domain-containing protein [Candidatus Schekmanbacteria bacterium]|nr:ankyrin repeat domain-containing protein [Candidatus Schekmanbacteria bacterium]
MSARMYWGWLFIGCAAVASVIFGMVLHDLHKERMPAVAGHEHTRRAEIAIIQEQLRTARNVSLSFALSSTLLGAGLLASGYRSPRVRMLRALRKHDFKKAEFWMSGLDAKVLARSLFDAIRSGNIDIVDWLLAHGVDANAAVPLSAPPLLEAVAQDSPELVRRLLAAGADPNVQYGDESLLGWVCACGDDTLLLECIQAGADVNLPTKTSPLLCAIRDSGKRDVVSKLLAAGAHVDAGGSHDERATPLMWAAALGQFEVVEELLLAGADPNALDANGKSVLDWAEAGVSDSARAARLRSSSGYQPEPSAHLKVMKCLTNVPGEVSTSQPAPVQAPRTHHDLTEQGGQDHAVPGSTTDTIQITGSSSIPASAGVASKYDERWEFLDKVKSAYKPDHVDVPLTPRARALLRLGSAAAGLAGAVVYGFLYYGVTFARAELHFFWALAATIALFSFFPALAGSAAGWVLAQAAILAHCASQRAMRVAAVFAVGGAAILFAMIRIQVFGDTVSDSEFLMLPLIVIGIPLAIIVSKEIISKTPFCGKCTQFYQLRRSPEHAMSRLKEILQACEVCSFGQINSVFSVEVNEVGNPFVYLELRYCPECKATGLLETRVAKSYQITSKAGSYQSVDEKLVFSRMLKADELKALGIA